MHNRAGGGVKNPDIRTEINPFHKSNCLFMFKESYALPLTITPAIIFTRVPIKNDDPKFN